MDCTTTDGIENGGEVFKYQKNFGDIYIYM